MTARKLIVRFPLLDTPRSITRGELSDLMDHVQRMSNERWLFVFQTPDFMEVME